jgi:hypothetical protein
MNEVKRGGTEPLVRSQLLTQSWKWNFGQPSSCSEQGSNLRLSEFWNLRENRPAVLLQWAGFEVEIVRIEMSEKIGQPSSCSEQGSRLCSVKNKLNYLARHFYWNISTKRVNFILHRKRNVVLTRTRPHGFQTSADKQGQTLRGAARSEQSRTQRIPTKPTLTLSGAQCKECANPHKRRRWDLPEHVSSTIQNLPK